MAASDGPGRYTLTVEGWAPPSVNKLLGVHWSTARRIKRDAYFEISVAQLGAGFPLEPARGRRRRVHVTVIIPGRSGLPDPDNVLKVTLDALKVNGLLVDDAAKWCEVGAVTVERGKAKRTVITLEDI